MGALFCAFVALGIVRAAIADTPLPQAFVSEVGKRVSYNGVVVADPDVRDANQRVQIRVSRGEESTKMLAVAPRYPSVAVGDRVFVSGTLEVPEAFADDPPSLESSGGASGGGRIFRYDKYLQRDGVRFILSFAYMRAESSAPWYSIPAALARVKHLFVDGIRATLPEPHASLAGGIVIGGKSGLGNELKEQFMRSGLIHMVVLSGHNVMVVATWVIAFFAFLFARVELIFKKRAPRWGSVALGVIALLLFVGIAGFSTTAIRAMLMALIALYARATGHTYAAGRALLFVVLLMLVWNPLYLVFDPGFALSIVATAGLIWLAPIVEYFLRIKNAFLREVMVTTIAAQIAVLPLLLYFTGNLSLVSLPANLLVMPVVPVAMGLSYIAGFAGVLFGSFAPLLGIALAFPAYLANAYLMLIAEESAALPFAAFALPLFPFWLVLVAYAALIFIASSKRFSTMLQLRFVKKASM
jgi:competence protein ComEC